MAKIIFCDLLSHETMHLPFNQSLIESLLGSFPDQEIYFYADDGHVARLQRAFARESRVKLFGIDRLTNAHPDDLHNPWIGRRVARECLNQISNEYDGDIVFAIFGGVDANLLSVCRRSRPVGNQETPYFYILHNQMDAAKQWRSRNPMVRWFDFISVLKSKLPARDKLLTLELGIKEEIEKEIPHLQGQVLTLEHPIVDSEILEPRPTPENGTQIKIGFLGHCGVGKGFDVFAKIASENKRKDWLEFHAVGRANENAAHLDLSGLKIRPVAGGLDRFRYLSRLENLDIVCLPINEGKRFVASGSLIDAFSACKPILIPRNPMVKCIEERYGAIGPNIADVGHLKKWISQTDFDGFAEIVKRYQENIDTIRQRRRSKNHKLEPIRKQIMS